MKESNAMTCCGNLSHRTPSKLATSGGRVNGLVLFEYDGEGPLTVFGRVTGIRYYFPGSGARRQVDPRDAPVLEITRGLRYIAAPATR